MINCGIISFTMPKTSQAEYDMKYNFWGYDKTREMNETGDNGNLSFITDYYDDFNKAKVIYSDWVQEPFSFVGYRGDEYSDYNLTPQIPDSDTILIADDYSISVLGPNKVAIELISGNSATQFRVFQNPNFVAGSSTDSDMWRNTNTDYLEFEYNLNEFDSLYDWFIQIKDREGNISSVKQIHIPFNYLRIIGPSGGYVFYDKGDSSDGWRYLEASPADLRVVDGVPTIDSNASGYSDATTGYVFGFYRTTDDGSNLYVNGTTTYNAADCTGTAIGTGKTNTQLLVNAMDDETYTSSYGSGKTGNYAAKLCDDLTYTVKGITYSDWFLPSRDELNLMYKQLKANGLGGFANSYYWSSSETAYSAGYACELSFYMGYLYEYSRQNYSGVWPVRVF